MKPKADEAKEIIEDLVHQFAHQVKHRGWPALATGGLSALEGAFSFLGWDDPHIVKDARCEVAGCREWATCGTPTHDAYVRCCGKHFAELQK